MNTIAHPDSVHHAPNTTSVSYLKKVPKLRHGDDEARAAELEQYIDDAEGGLRSILKAGFFLECLAADLKHGQLGPWVNAHCKKSWRTIQRWKEISGSLGDKLGISLKKRLQYKLHEVLALPPAKVPDDVKPIREKIDAEIEGKSANQLFLELKQVDEDDPSKPKRGRLKGSSGLTKEQRERAAQRAEAARIEELEEQTGDTAKWLLENADAKNLGIVSDKSLRKLRDAAETALGFIKRVEATRGDSRKGNP